jgi:hypothetical protein
MGGDRMSAVLRVRSPENENALRAKLRDNLDEKCAECGENYVVHSRDACPNLTTVFTPLPAEETVTTGPDSITVTRVLPLHIHYAPGTGITAPYFVPEPKVTKKPRKPRAKKAETVVLEPLPEAVEMPPIEPEAPSFYATGWETRDDSPLWTRYGFELTFMPEDYKKGAGDEGEEGGIEYSGGVNHTKLQRGLWGVKHDFYTEGEDGLAERTYLDSHVVEIPSPPVATLEGAKRVYDFISTVARNNGLVPQSELIGTGSNHINLNLPRRMIVRLLRDIANRPYVIWAFNDPCDVQDGCIPKTEDATAMRKRVYETRPGMPNKGALFEVIYHTPYEVVAKEIMDRSHRDGCSYGPLRTRSLHRETYSYDRARGESRAPLLTELRMFEAPANWKEFSRQIEFVDAYLRHLANVKWADLPPPAYENASYVTKAVNAGVITLEKCEEDFAVFLLDLGLSPGDYERQFENMRRRWKLGSPYLQ